MTPMEIACDFVCRWLAYVTIFIVVPYGCWWDDANKRTGRAIDAYLNGREAVIYLPPMQN